MTIHFSKGVWRVRCGHVTSTGSNLLRILAMLQRANLSAFGS